MDRIQHLVPSFDGGDNFVWVCGPCEAFRLVVVLGEEAIDGSLEVNDGVEDTAFQATFGEFGKEAFDGIEPRAGCRDEVKREARMAVEPCLHLDMLVRGIIVENDVHGLVGWHTGIDRVQKPDELLMPVLLHVAPDHGSIKDVEHGKQYGDAVTLVIMGHRAKSPLFEREPRLRAVKRLNLAFLIEGQHDGVD